VQYIILLGIAIAIIYGIIKLLIWLVPLIAKGLLIVFGVGCVAGVIVGVVYGIKNYVSSILENIENKPFKILMMVITSAIILLLIYYLFAIGIYVAKLII